MANRKNYPRIENHYMIFRVKKSDFKIDLQNENIYEIIKNNNFDLHMKSNILEKYLEYNERKVNYESDGVEFTESENDDLVKEPYDPSNVKYSLKLFSVLSLFNYITGYDNAEESTIEMRPEFQRNYVWSNKEKSRLIESMLLNIPIPSIYLNETIENKYLPADGLQRLNAIREFLSGELKLSGLEYLTQYEGMYFLNKNPDNVLPLQVRRHIRDYQLTCFVIHKETPDKVKLDIFKRLNTTGIKLTAQELRNSVTDVKVKNIYNSVDRIESFNILLKSSVNTNRFVHHEFILRFFGEYFYRKSKIIEYKGNMSSLLNETLIVMKNLNSEELDSIREYFIDSLNQTYRIFGPDAFRKPSSNRRKSPINTVLYSQILVNIKDFCIPNGSNAIETKIKFDKMIEDNPDFLLAISSATNNISNIDLARKYIISFFEQISI